MSSKTPRTSVKGCLGSHQAVKTRRDSSFDLSKFRPGGLYPPIGGSYPPTRGTCPSRVSAAATEPYMGALKTVLGSTNASCMVSRLWMLPSSKLHATLCTSVRCNARCCMMIALCTHDCFSTTANPGMLGVAPGCENPQGFQF